MVVADQKMVMNCQSQQFGKTKKNNVAAQIDLSDLKKLILAINISIWCSYFHLIQLDFKVSTILQSVLHRYSDSNYTLWI